MKFSDSILAHTLLDSLSGVEIGASAHNPFNLPSCQNIDYTNDMETVFKKGEEKLCGEKAPVDIVAPGDDLPFNDASVDYVISSHVIEHFFDPIKALKEWWRVVRPGGFVFIICPKPDAIPEEDRGPMEPTEFWLRHTGAIEPKDVYMGEFQTSTVTGLPFNSHGHWSVWNLDAFLGLCLSLKMPIHTALATDDKVENGFCVVLQKPQGEN